MLKLRIINKPKMYKLKCNFAFPNIILANMQEKEVTPTKEIQEIVPDIQYDGLSKVTINPIPDEYIIPSGEIEFTQNGTYDVTDKASAKVNVPEKILGTKTITKNGIYNASDDGVDGYSEVEVACGKYAPRIISFNGYQGSELNYEIENLDTSNLNSTKAMFSNCSYLTDLDLSNFDTSSVSSMDNMFNSCSRLENLNLSNFITNNLGSSQYMFAYCSALKSLDLSNFNTSKVINMAGMFYGCKKLSNIPKLNASSSTNTSSFAYRCPLLTDFGGLENLGQAYSTTQSANYSNYKLDLSSCTALTEQSLINVLNNLYDIATKGCKSQQVVLGSTNLAKLTSTEGQQALSNSQAKGWSIS